METLSIVLACLLVFALVLFTAATTAMGVAYFELRKRTRDLLARAEGGIEQVRTTAHDIGVVHNELMQAVNLHGTKLNELEFALGMKRNT